MLKPLADNILVTVEAKQETTDGGLIVPDNASFDRPTMGKVTAIGKDVQLVSVNDEVVFTKYSPTEVKIKDVVYYLLKEVDVLAIIE